MSAEQRQTSRVDHFAQLASRFFADAERQGFPAFLTSIDLSTPANATPYLTGIAEFRAALRRWPNRGALLAALEQMLLDATPFGVVVEALFVGGSFLDSANINPRDLDCLILYRKAHTAEPVSGDGLSTLQKEAALRGVDARFVPTDGDLMLLVKCVSYFTTLYSQEKPAVHTTHRSSGFVLVDCGR